MSFSSYTPLSSNPGDGVATTFAIPDKFYDDDAIKVFTVDASGVETSLVEGVDFTVVTTLKDPTPPSRKTGNIVLTLPAAIGVDVVILIWPASDQDQTFEGRPVTPRQNERVHDRHSMRDAALRELFNRGFRAPLNTTPALRFISIGTEGAVPAFDANGNLVEGPQGADIANAEGYANSAATSAVSATSSASATGADVVSTNADVISSAASASSASTSASNAASSASAAQVAKMKWQGSWVTSTAYALNDVIEEAGSSYICIIAHTSGMFNTDLTANRWELVAQKGIGDMLGDNNLSELTDVSFSRLNLGVGEFETVSAMVSNVNITVGNIVKTLGYYTKGDGGGNTYEIVAVGTGAGDKGSFINLITHQAQALFPNGLVNDKQFGTVGDGVVDDYEALANALTFVNGTFDVLYLGSPTVGWRTTATLIIDDKVSVYGNGYTKSIIKPDASVTPAVQVGDTTYHRGTISDIGISRSSYTVGTTGFAFVDCIQGRYINLETRLSEIGYEYKPATGKRVAYTYSENLRSVGHKYGLYNAMTGTGWVNSNKFISGRFQDLGNLDTQVHFDTNSSENSFYGISFEGNGQQGVLIGGYGNTIFDCRFEGVWANNGIVLTSSSLRNIVIQHNFHSTITDNGAGNSYLSHNSGNKFSSLLSSLDVLTLDYAGTANGHCLKLTSSKDLDSSFGIRMFSNGAPRASLTTSGILDVYKGLRIGGAGYQYPVRLAGASGAHIWTDVNSGTIRVKHGAAPTSNTDGYQIQITKTSISIGFNNAANVVNTRQKEAGSMVWDIGLKKPLWANGSSATSVWTDATGATIYTPS